MPAPPSIGRLILSRLQPFQFCDLNFTDPTSGAALPEVCLIGDNGTGKSTVLSQLYYSFEPKLLPTVSNPNHQENSLVLTQFIFEDRALYQARPGSCQAEAAGQVAWFSHSIEKELAWQRLKETLPGYQEFLENFGPHQLEQSEFPVLTDTSSIFFSPQLTVIDSRDAGNFESLIHSCHTERRNAYHTFLESEENRDRTVSEVEADFLQQFPDPLAAIAENWKPLLDELALEFSPNHPAPLRSTSTDEAFRFESLSPGLQSYLFRTALIVRQGSSRSVPPGITCLDEPECGLSPELIESFIDACRSSSRQLVVATHLENVAGQFEGHEVIRLTRNASTHHIQAESLVPLDDLSEPAEGDSSPAASPKKPNPGSRHYTQLIRKIQETEDQDELADLIDEAMFLRKP
ncbi:MAG: AAA family ATPase [Verrucomicrobiota bacterium]